MTTFSITEPWLAAYVALLGGAQPWLTDPAPWVSDGLPWSDDDKEYYANLRDTALQVARLEPLKTHLGILDCEDDGVLLRLLPVAESILANDIGAAVATQYRQLPPALQQAVLLKAAHLFWNRNPVLVDHSMVILAMGYDDIIAPYVRQIC